MLGKMREGEVDDDKGMVNDVEAVQNQGRREMLNCFREGISVFCGGGVDGNGGSDRVDGGDSGVFWSGGGGLFRIG